MAADETASPPSEAELRAEIRRLQYFLACWNVGVLERQAAQLSLRIARAALATLEKPDFATRHVAQRLLADLRHLVRWHDQLGPADLRMAETTVSKAARLFGGESPNAGTPPPLIDRFATEAHQFLVSYSTAPSPGLVNDLALLLAVIDAEATKRARDTASRNVGGGDG